MESLIVVLVCIILIYLIKCLFGIKIDDVKMYVLDLVRRRNTDIIKENNLL